MNTPEQIVNAFDEGWKAYWAKQEQDSNPYADNDELSEEWNLGFVRAFDADQHEL